MRLASLRARLFAAIAARRAALARPRARDRRRAHAPGGRAEHAPGRLRRSSTCSPSASARRCCRSRGACSLQPFLERQDERVVQVPLDGSSPYLLPPERAAKLRRGAQLDGTLETDGTRYFYAARLVERQGLRAAAADRARRTRPGARTSRALIVAALAAAALAALAAFLLARAIARPVRPRRRGDARPRSRDRASRRSSRSRARASSRCSPRPSTSSPSSSRRRARRSARSCSPSATS